MGANWRYPDAVDARVEDEVVADSEAADAEADVGSPADSASRRDPIGAVFSAASSSSSLASFLEREASSPSFSGRSSVSRRNVSKDAAAPALAFGSELE